MGYVKNHYMCDACDQIHAGDCDYEQDPEPNPIDYYEPLWQKVWEEALNGNDPNTRDSDWSKAKMRFLCLTHGQQLEEVRLAEVAVRSLEVCAMCGKNKDDHFFLYPERYCPAKSDVPGNPHTNHTEPCGADCIPF